MIACVYLAGTLWCVLQEWYLLPLAGIAGIMAVLWHWRSGRRAAALLWFLLLTAVWLTAVFRFNDRQNLREQYTGALTEGETVRVLGKLTKKESRSTGLRYELQDCRLLCAGKSCSCRNVLIYVDSDDFIIGDTLEIIGQVHIFEQAVDEGMFDLQTYYVSQGIDFALYPEEIFGRASVKYAWREAMYQLRLRMSRVIAEAMEERRAGVLSSMLFGEKSLLDAEVKSLYQAAGISHILAISGLHVSLVGTALYRLLRRLHQGFLRSALFSALVLAAYTVMTGSAVSTRRAAGMLLLTMAGQVLGRQTDLMNSLGGMVLVLLWQEPTLCSYSGFAFSVLAVTGIGVTAKVYAYEGEEYRGRLPGRIRKLQESLWTSAAISLTTLPLVMASYYEVPTGSVFLNLLILPTVSLLFAFGMAGSLLGLFFLPLGKILLQPASLMLGLYERLCSGMLALPGSSLVTGAPGRWRMLLFYLLLAGGLSILQSRKKKRNTRTKQELLQGGKREWPWAGTFFSGRFLLTAFLLLFLLCPLPKGMEIDILDVGQGDGIFIRSGDGSTYLIDGGSVTEDEVGTYRILPFLKYKGLDGVKYWFVSHGDSDHISGLLEVLESGFSVEYLILAEAMPRDEAWEELTEAAEKAGTQILYMSPGDRIAGNKSSITCIYPESGLGDTFTDRNDLSLVLLYREEAFSALFAGDLSEEAEEILVRQKLVGRVDLYKVCHHGSRYSSSTLLMKALQPQISVISCGLNNSYGHPAQEAVERIEQSGSRIFYTMTGGEISICRKKDRILVRTFLEE